MPCKQMVTSQDKQRVIDRILKARSSWVTYAPCIDWFRSELDKTRPVAATDVPADVITMNSRFVATDLRTLESTTYTLVYPEDEALDRENLCVLNPMGMALLSARVGEIVRWRGECGFEAVEVTRILYQPEAAGDLHL